MYYEFKKAIKGIIYWCDTMGHLHHNDDYDLRSPKELPKELQVALGNLWVNGTYLVEFNSHYGAAIEASYDQDLASILSISYEDLKKFAKAKAKKYAEKYPDLDIIFGDDTTEWNDGSVETTILVICPWDMKERDFFDVELYIKSTKYTNINTEKNPEGNSEKTEKSEIAENESKYGIKITYSWGDEEPVIKCETKDAAWKKAKELALEEISVSCDEHDCEMGVMVDTKNSKITLHYSNNMTLNRTDEYCYYEICEL